MDERALISEALAMVAANADKKKEADASKFRRENPDIPVDASPEDVRKYKMTEEYREAFYKGYSEWIGSAVEKSPNLLNTLDPNHIKYRNGISGGLAAFGHSFSQSRRNVKASSFYARMAEGDELLPEEKLALESLEKEIKRNDVQTGDGGLVNTLNTGLAAAVPTMIEPLVESLKYGAAGAATAGAATLTANAAVASTGVGALPAAVSELLSVGTGFLAGSTYGAFTASERMARGFAFKRYRDQMEAVLGHGLDGDELLAVQERALKSGTLQAIPEALMNAHLMKLVPGVGKIMSPTSGLQFLGKAETRLAGAAGSGWVKQAAVATAARGVESGILEGATEGIQNLIEQWYLPTPLSTRESLSEFGENVLVGGFAGGVFGGTFAQSETMSKFVSARNAATRYAASRNAVDALKKSVADEGDIENSTELNNLMLQTHGIKPGSFDPEKVAELNGKLTDEIVEKIPSLAARLREAGKSGMDMEVSLADIAALETAMGGNLLGDLSHDGEMTHNEAKTYFQRNKAGVKELLEITQRDIEEIETGGGVEAEIHKRVVDSLNAAFIASKGVDMTPNQEKIHHMQGVYALSIFRSLAKDAGIPLLKYYEEHAPEIVGRQRVIVEKTFRNPFTPEQQAENRAAADKLMEEIKARRAQEAAEDAAPQEDVSPLNDKVEVESEEDMEARILAEEMAAEEAAASMENDELTKTFKKMEAISEAAEARKAREKAEADAEQRKAAADQRSADAALQDAVAKAEAKAAEEARIQAIEDAKTPEQKKQELAAAIVADIDSRLVLTKNVWAQPDELRKLLNYTAAPGRGNDLKFKIKRLLEALREVDPKHPYVADRRKAGMKGLKEALAAVSPELAAVIEPEAVAEVEVQAVSTEVSYDVEMGERTYKDFIAARMQAAEKEYGPSVRDERDSYDTTLAKEEYLQQLANWVSEGNIPTQRVLKEAALLHGNYWHQQIRGTKAADILAEDDKKRSLYMHEAKLIDQKNIPLIQKMRELAKLRPWTQLSSSIGIYTDGKNDSASLKNTSKNVHIQGMKSTLLRMSRDSRAAAESFYAAELKNGDYTEEIAYKAEQAARAKEREEAMKRILSDDEVAPAPVVIAPAPESAALPTEEVAEVEEAAAVSSFSSLTKDEQKEKLTHMGALRSAHAEASSVVDERKKQLEAAKKALFKSRNAGGREKKDAELGVEVAKDNLETAERSEAAELEKMTVFSSELLTKEEAAIVDGYRAGTLSFVTVEEGDRLLALLKRAPVTNSEIRNLRAKVADLEQALDDKAKQEAPSRVTLVVGDHIAEDMAEAQEIAQATGEKIVAVEVVTKPDLDIYGLAKPKPYLHGVDLKEAKEIMKEYTSLLLLYREKKASPYANTAHADSINRIEKALIALNEKMLDLQKRVGVPGKIEAGSLSTFPEGSMIDVIRLDWPGKKSFDGITNWERAFEIAAASGIDSTIYMTADGSGYLAFDSEPSWAKGKIIARTEAAAYTARFRAAAVAQAAERQAAEEAALKKAKADKEEAEKSAQLKKGEEIFGKIEHKGWVPGVGNSKDFLQLMIASGTGAFSHYASISKVVNKVIKEEPESENGKAAAALKSAAQSILARMKIDKTMTKKDRDFISSATAASDERAVLTNIAMSNGVMVATDGRRAHIMKAPDQLGKTSATISPDTWAQSPYEMPQFPNFNILIPSVMKHSVSVASIVELGTVEIPAEILPGDKRMMEERAKRKGEEFKMPTSDAVVFSALGDGGKLLHFAINAGYFKNAVNGGMTTMRFNDNLGPITFEGEGKFAVIMPLKLKVDASKKFVQAKPDTWVREQNPLLEQAKDAKMEMNFHPSSPRFLDGRPTDVTYYQGDQGDENALGSFTPGRYNVETGTRGRDLITLFEGHNPTTFIHEMAHFYLERVWRSGTTASATAKQKRRWENLSKAMGWKSDLLGLSVTQHERFARSVEAHLRYRKDSTPNLAMKGFFQAFGAFMREVYKNARELKAPMSPELLDFFDSVYGAEDMIETAAYWKRRSKSFEQRFSDAKGAAKEDQKAYNEKKAKWEEGQKVKLDAIKAKFKEKMDAAAEKAEKEKLKVEMQREIQQLKAEHFEVALDQAVRAFRTFDEDGIRELLGEAGYARHLALADDAIVTARGENLAKHLRERDRIMETREEIAATHSEKVRQELAQRKHHRVELHFRPPPTVDGKKVGVQAMPIEFAALVRELTLHGVADAHVKVRAFSSRFPRAVSGEMKSGVNPVDLARNFGFSNPAEMVHSMMEAPNYEDAVQIETDARVDEEMGWNEYGIDDVRSMEAIKKGIYETELDRQMQDPFNVLMKEMMSKNMRFWDETIPQGIKIKDSLVGSLAWSEQKDDRFLVSMDQLVGSTANGVKLEDTRAVAAAVAAWVAPEEKASKFAEAAVANKGYRQLVWDSKLSGLIPLLNEKQLKEVQAILNEKSWRIASKETRNDSRVRMIQEEILALRKKVADPGLALDMEALSVAIREKASKMPYATSSKLKQDGLDGWTKYDKMERRSSDRAYLALREGKYAEALKAKEAQLAHLLHVRHMLDAASRHEKISSFLAGVGSGRIDGDVDSRYRDRIYAILANCGFKIPHGVPLNEELLADMEAWAEQQNSMLGGEIVAVSVTIFPEALNPTARHSVDQNSTLGEIEDIERTIRSLIFSGKRIRDAQIGERNRIRKENLAKLLIPLQAGTVGGPIPTHQGDSGFMDRMKTAAKSFMSAFLRAEFYIRAWDGALKGAWRDIVWTPIYNSGLRGQEITGSLSERVSEMAKTDTKLHSRMQAEHHVAVAGRTYRGHEIVTLAMLCGQDSRKRKVLQGYNDYAVSHGLPAWIEVDEDGHINELRYKMVDGKPVLSEDGDTVIESILANLTAEDANYVNLLWSEFDRLWPQLDEEYRKLYGEGLTKENSVSFALNLRDAQGNLKEVTFHGGYCPLTRDMKFSREAFKGGGQYGSQASSMDDIFLSEIHGMARPANGHTKNLTGAIYAPSLDLLRVMQKFQTQVHDLTHRNAVIEVDWLLRQPEIEQAIVNRSGRDAYMQMQGWIRHVASPKQDAYGLDGVNGVMRKFRMNVTQNLLGLRLSVMLAQANGLFNLLASPDVKAGATFKALFKSYVKGNFQDAAGNQSPHQFFLQAREKVMAKSLFMRERMKGIGGNDRDMSEMSSRIIRGQTVLGSEKLGQLSALSFWTIVQADSMISVPAWLAGYDTALHRELSAGTDPKEAERIAIDEGDAIVRATQSANAAADLPALLRSPVEFLRWATAFKGPVNTMLNAAWLEYDQARVAWKLDKKTFLQASATAFLRLAILTTLPVAFTGIIKDRWPDDDDDDGKIDAGDYAEWLAKGVGAYSIDAVPMASAVQAVFDVKNPRITDPIAIMTEKIRKAAGSAQADEIDAIDLAVNGTDAVAVVTGLPIGQLTIWVNNLLKSQDGELKGDVNRPEWAEVIPYWLVKKLQPE